MASGRGFRRVKLPKAEASVKRQSSSGGASTASGGFWLHALHTYQLITEYNFYLTTYYTS
jgi:hypothetical protein